MFLVACGEKEPMKGPPTKSPIPLLDAYAATLVNRHAGDLESFISAHLTQDSPLSYLTFFRAGSKEMLTAQGRNLDDDALRNNQTITARWEKIYCTAELQEVMRLEGVMIAVGQLIDESDRKHSSAMCITGQIRSAPEATATKLADVGRFSTEQICKAGVALMYGRDVGIMSAEESGDHVRITYTRPTDDKDMSYRCRLENDLILTWDDSIAGARWYGNLADDTKLAFRVSGADLVIQDVIRGSVNRKKSYSFSDIH